MQIYHTKDSVAMIISVKEAQTLSRVLFNLLQIDNGVDCSCMGHGMEDRETILNIYNNVAAPYA
jgi:hypothetical protein